MAPAAIPACVPPPPVSGITVTIGGEVPVIKASIPVCAESLTWLIPQSDRKRSDRDL